MRKIFILLFFLGQFCSVAQDSLLIVEVEDVVISSTRINTDLLSSSLAIKSLEVKPDLGLQGFSMKDQLQMIPGLFAINQYNSAQDMRISIRGFGARSAFGIRGVKILMDGIPLTTPDGQGQIDNVIVSGIKGLEVISGSSSALYGNASGGVLSFTTFSDKDQTDHVYLGYGSFNNFQVAGEVRHGNDDFIMDHQVSYNQIDGYRDQSSSKNLIYNGRLKRVFKNGSEGALILNFLYSPEGDDAGGLTLDEAMTDPGLARDRNISFNAGEELNQVTAALKYKWNAINDSYFKFSSFYTRRDFQNRLPFENGGQVDLLRNYGGSNIEYIFPFSAGEWKGEWLAGIDLAFQNDKRIRFNNLEGDRGNLSLDQNEIFNNQAAYLTFQSTFRQFLVNAGLRFDNNQIKVQDSFTENGDQSGNIALTNFSPSISLSYRLYNYHYVRAAFSYGFETPTLTELSNRPDNSGGFNLELQPQQSYNYELGYRARWSDLIFTDLTFFTTQSIDELLPYEIADFPGRTFYRNAGKTQRNGVEFALRLKPNAIFNADVSYSYSDFKFVDQEDLDGNRLPGIPVHNLATRLGLEKKGWKGQFSYNYYSAIFVDNGNETQVEPFSLASISISKRFGYFIPNIGINNLFNAEYNDNIRINAFGNRYYEPGPPRNYYIGVKIEF